MKRNDLAVITASCLVTLGLCSVSLIWDSIYVAQADEGKVKRAKIIRKAAHKLGGAELKCALRKNDGKPGKKPVIVLDLKEVTGKGHEIPLELSIASSTPSITVSRVMPIPKQAWATKKVIHLDKNEQKTVEIPVDGDLKKGSMLSLEIKSGKERIYPFSFVSNLTVAPNGLK